MTMPTDPTPAELDTYEALFARNHDSVENRIENALFCLTTLVWDAETRAATIFELKDALARLRALKETWDARPPR